MIPALGLALPSPEMLNDLVPVAEAEFLHSLEEQEFLSGRPSLGEQREVQTGDHMVFVVLLVGLALAPLGEAKWADV